MPRARKLHSSITIIGPGRLGSALARNLDRAGWKIDAIVIRADGRKTGSLRKLARELGALVTTVREYSGASDVVWITVPDAVIAELAAELSQRGKWRGKTVFHSSGALTSDELAVLRKEGAKVASVHPAMTFVAKSEPKLAGVPFAIEGDAAAVRLARRVIADLGGLAFAIRKENKVLYHAFDTFASPMLIGLMAAMEQVGKAAGIPASRARVMAGPLLRRTLENYLEHGAAAALSGALVRGDVATVRGHVKEMTGIPAARAVYLALAKLMVQELPVRNRRELEQWVVREQ